MRKKHKTLATGRKPGSGNKKGSIRELRSRDSILLDLFNVGDHFFTLKEDKEMTALAHAYGVKIKTERLLAIHPIKHTVEKILRVTIVAINEQTQNA